jgi:23S rRNA (uracil1939-C5)-methyltransferase
MIARHDGQIVFVRGAIPGERVRARVERRQKHMLWAETVDVIEASPDRREPPCDLACGGSAYAHIRYERQCALKAAIVVDAFARIAKAPLDGPVEVVPSREDGYRMRARLHIHGDRWGFLREGSRVLCDAASTGQLLPETLAAVAAAAEADPARLSRSGAIIVSENVDASERAIYFEPKEAIAPPAQPGRSAPHGQPNGGRVFRPSRDGGGVVRDTATSLFGADVTFDVPVVWARRATSFFQGNRYLLGALVRRVIDAAAAERVVDLYAGVGLFALPLAARGARVIAVEGDPSGGADLAENARPFADRIRALRGSVEDAVVLRDLTTPDVVVLDPPRTGASPEAMAGLLAWSAPRIVYVSCDPPTLARDSARLLAAGYRLISIVAFDCFPNTPHVECVAVFDRG